MKNLIYLFLLISFFLFSRRKKTSTCYRKCNYDKGPLKNPVNDASLIAKTLEDLDFEVMLYKNLETRQLLKAISEIWYKKTIYDVGFVYYAGHGIQVNR